MKNIFLITMLFCGVMLFAQNNQNTNNRQHIAYEDSLITNTYNLEMNLENQEPVAKTNVFQDPNNADVSWKDVRRDEAGNIIYDRDPFVNNGNVNWQDYSNWSSREKQGMWNPMPYSYVSENDVMWAKRITREIVLNDPGNVSLMFPRLVKYTSHSGSLGSQAAYNEVLTGIDARKNLFSILYDAALSGQVNVYNRRMSRLFSDSEIKGDLSDLQNPRDGIFNYVRESKTAYQVNGRTRLKDTIVALEIDANDIIKYEIVEDWFFDKRRSKMDVRIVSITPIAAIKSDPDATDADERECGTFYYPEIRALLANHKIHNTDNMMDRMSFDEFFQRRLFSSYITKESNVYDRRLSEYINEGDQLSQLWEGERIKENIRSFESSMWEY